MVGNRFVLPGAGVTQGQISRGQEDIPGRGNSMCASMKTYKKEKYGMSKCRNIMDSHRGRLSEGLAESSGLVIPSNFLLRLVLLQPPSSLHLLCAKHCARCWPRVRNRSRRLDQGGLCDQLQIQRSLWLVLFWR